ncbi:MAG: hypothetical protein OEZ29_03020 [Candidatus Bathyarchaeota archaeon]|nr:hypothetical protein [Candidatus Bathyarchaeota archaeon]MDH5779548.1 hypothetical protein [Candidatus Bathyarchaeota archaeon]
MRIKQDKRGISNVIVFVLGLVIVVVIVSNVFLWNYEMNQLDWERMREDIEILDVAPLSSSSWFVAESEYNVNEGGLIGGNYTDTQEVDGSHETFMEGIIAQTLHPHSANISGVTPAGKLMNGTQPPLNQPETEYTINRGSSVYFYTPTLAAGSIENGTWTLYIWASTVSSGKVSHLTIQIHLVSSDGSTEKATIGIVTDVIIDYGYSERTVTISGSAANVTSGDRIRLTLYAQTGAIDDPKGISFYYDGYGIYETPGHETRVQSPSPGGYGLDLNGTFSIDVSTFPLAFVQTVEIQLRYSANDTGEKWYLEAYNWTSSTYSDLGFNSTTGHTPTTGWDYYAVNLTDQWNSYVQSNGTIYVKVIDEGADTNQTMIDIDFLGVRTVIDGTKFTFRNEGALTSRLVSLWIINSTYHKRYDMDLIINSAQTITYTRANINLSSGQYTVKVITERGNKDTHSGG